MAEGETVEQFKARMKSLQVMKGGRPRDKVRTITRPVTDPGIDAGKKAKQTKDELGTVITESDNRQDVNVCPQTHVQSIGFNGQ